MRKNLSAMGTVVGEFAVICLTEYRLSNCALAPEKTTKLIPDRGPREQIPKVYLKIIEGNYLLFTFCMLYRIIKKVICRSL